MRHKTLPQYFCVEKNTSNPLWKPFTQWLEKIQGHPIPKLAPGWYGFFPREPYALEGAYFKSKTDTGPGVPILKLTEWYSLLSMEERIEVDRSIPWKTSAVGNYNSAFCKSQKDKEFTRKHDDETLQAAEKFLSSEPELLKVLVKKAFLAGYDLRVKQQQDKTEKFVDGFATHAVFNDPEYHLDPETAIPLLCISDGATLLKVDSEGFISIREQIVGHEPELAALLKTRKGWA